MRNAGPYDRVARDLRESAFGSIEYRAQTGSTNEDAAALLGDARFGGHTIVAEHQLRGAGRKGRSWEALPETALLFTTILPREIPTGRLWIVPFWTALAVRDGLAACGVAALLQWPNDLLLGDRKLAGILLQSRVTGAAARVACGVGINVHRPVDRARNDSGRWAFCDDVAAVGRTELLRAVLLAFERTMSMQEHPSEVATRWEAAAGVPGRRYRIVRDGETTPFDATAMALEPGGALRIARDDGRNETIDMADARVVR